jgi:hypothetical protein
MAKSRALVRFQPRPAPPVIVVNSGARRGARVRRAAGHVVHHARRGGRALGRAGKRSLPVLGLALGGAAIGYAESKKWLDKLPSIGGSRALPIALLGFGITKMVKNPTARMAGLAMIVAGAFDWGRVQGGSVTGFEGEDGGAGHGGGF